MPIATRRSWRVACTHPRSMFATLSLVRLQNLALVARKVLAENAPIAARVCGLHLKLDQPARGLASLGVFALGLLWLATPGSISSPAAIGCFLAAVGLRFGFLFTSFVPNGVAPRLAARFGAERGHPIYAAALDLLMFTQRVSFVALVCATAREASSVFGGALQVLGLLMALAGAGVTVWATRVAGVDAYHYRDLFTRRSTSLESSGPYLYSANPMYALGPLAGYGLALLALSPIALLAAGLNQALLFAFHETVEQPWVRRSHSIFIETQRRYELARSLLGFDPREELAQRQHWTSDEPAADDTSHLAT